MTINPRIAELERKIRETKSKINVLEGKEKEKERELDRDRKDLLEDEGDLHRLRSELIMLEGQLNGDERQIETIELAEKRIAQEEHRNTSGTNHS